MVCIFATGNINLLGHNTYPHIYRMELQEMSDSKIVEATLIERKHLDSKGIWN